MGKKRRGHPDIQDVLGRPWCYYCERDFEDLKLLISHQKAKHFKCDRCGRRLNTAGGLSVHLNQVHKETLDQVENALPHRQGLEVEIFGMEGIPGDVLDQHRNRIIQNFYKAQEDRRVATGNPLPGHANQRKKIKIETPDELRRRVAEFMAHKHAVKANGGVEPVQEVQDVQSVPESAPAPAAAHAPSYAEVQPVTAPTGLPQRPQALEEDEGTKKKEKKGRMIYDDAEFSPEERMAALPRYAFVGA